MVEIDAAAPRLRGLRALLARLPAIGSLVALALVVAFNLAFTKGFANIELQGGRLVGALVDIVQNGAPVMLLAIGMTLVIASSGIDLSVGSVMALSGTIAALLVSRRDFSAGAAIAVSLAAALAAGLWNGALVVAAGLQPIVATLITLVAGRGVAQALSDDQKVRFSNAALELIANGTVLGLPVPLYIVVAAALGLGFALGKTALGLYLEALGVNLEAARLCGLPTSLVRLAVYAICALCAGVAGLIATADIREADVANCGLHLELDAILAVVIGGTSLTGGKPRLMGSIVGALVMQTLTVGLQMRGVLAEHTLLVKALAALLVCVIQSPGLAPRSRLVSDRPSS